MKKWQIGWGPISSCNMDCKFCYSKMARDNIGNLEIGDWIKFADENHQNIQSINYGTGENTLSSDWFRLAHYIRNNYPSICQALTTNGYLSQQIRVSAEFKDITDKSIDEIDISLDFCDKELHNDFRGQEFAYDWAMDSLRYCLEHNKLATIVFLGTDRTLDKANIAGLFEIADRYDAKLRMNIYRPTDGINSKTKEFIASYDKIIETLYFINGGYKILAICDPLFGSLLTDSQIEADPSGDTSLRILPDGSITPSTYLITDNFRKANIKEKNILFEIEKNDYFSQIAKAGIPEDCMGCAFSSRCKGGVLDRRYLWYQNFRERDPYCPFRSGEKVPEKKVEIHRSFESIHDGYLPTIFFSNK